MNINGAKICAIFNFEFFSLSLNIMKRAEKGKEKLYENFIRFGKPSALSDLKILRSKPKRESKIYIEEIRNRKIVRKVVAFSIANSNQPCLRGKSD